MGVKVVLVDTVHSTGGISTFEKDGNLVVFRLCGSSLCRRSILN